MRVFGQASRPVRRGVLCLMLASLWLCLPAILPASRTISVGQDAGTVDLLLVLGIDCSYSVDQSEFLLQVEGLARAFRDPEIIEAIGKGPYGRIAVSVVQWSDSTTQAVVIPWMVLGGARDALGLSSRIATMRRLTAVGSTSISGMIRFAAAMLLGSPFKATRRVVDISADGRNNTGGRPDPVRDSAAASGITINGLAILNEVPTLDRYFELHVTGGPANFVIVANDYAAYAAAIRRKILMEVLGATVS